MKEIEKALECLRQGREIMLFDSEDREGETDIAIPARGITPAQVAHMRCDGGGLICVAIHPEAAKRLSLPFIADVLKKAGSNGFASLRGVAENSGDVKYDTRSSFSLWVNHRDTFTGITDVDRSLTIHRLGEIVDSAMGSAAVDFGRQFRSPGHVAVLRAADNLLDERRGQTELSIALAILAGITPAMAICEMLDGCSGYALSKKQALEYAKKNRVVFVEGADVIREFSGRIR